MPELKSNSQKPFSGLTVDNLTVLYSMSSICSRAISVRRALICWLALSWFTITLFLMLRALLAYFSVFSVSMKSWSDGLMQAIIIVRLRDQRKWKRFIWFLTLPNATVPNKAFDLDMNQFWSKCADVDENCYYPVIILLISCYYAVTTNLYAVHEQYCELVQNKGLHISV